MKPPQRSLILVTAAFFCAGLQPLSAQYVTTIASPSEGEGYQFGNAVSIDGNYLVIGEWQNIDDGGDGNAFVYNRTGPNTWVLQDELETITGNPTGANFGRSVAIRGNRAVVGAYNENITGCDTRDGAAYLFSRSGSTWTQVERFFASDCDEEDEIGDRFGTAVDVAAADLVIVGAYLDDPNEVNGAGSAYIYYKDETWHEVKIDLDSPIAEQAFGQSVSIDGDVAVVGAPYGDMGSQSGAGSVYVYKKTTNGGVSWGLQATLTGEDEGLNAAANFGVDVSIEGGRIIVGAKDAHDGGDLVGAAYVYELNGSTWELMDGGTLQPTELEDLDQFGVSVSISGDYVIVGAKARDDETGSAYVYHWNGTTWGTPIYTLDGTAEHGEFGHSVSIDMPYAAVGAPGFDLTPPPPPPGSDEGKAYAYGFIELSKGAQPTTGPVSFRLEQNYPNPFNPATTINYDLAEEVQITLAIYDMLGQEIIVLVDEIQTSGPKSIEWNGKDKNGHDISSGVYTCLLKAGSSITSRKMIAIK